MSAFTYDTKNQLTAADHAGSGPPDESYSFDANGNRTGGGHSTGGNNRTTSDGVYDYEYDDEGNRTAKEHIASGAREEYAWDHRNRLTSITFRNSSNAVVKTVEQTYDVFDQLIGQAFDDDADAEIDRQKYWAWEGGQETLEFAGSEAADLSHRYLWGEAVDFLLADEQITTAGDAGNAIWPLGDHLGTLRDLVDLSGSTVSVINHREYNALGSLTKYNALGSLTSETNASVDLRFGYTGRAFDEDFSLNYHRARWYDAALGQWLSEDPIGFAAGDVNLQRYVGNRVVTSFDPNGESWLSSIYRYFFPKEPPQLPTGSAASASDVDTWQRDIDTDGKPLTPGDGRKLDHMDIRGEMIATEFAIAACEELADQLENLTWELATLGLAHGVAPIIQVSRPLFGSARVLAKYGDEAVDITDRVVEFQRKAEKATGGTVDLDTAAKTLQRATKNRVFPKVTKDGKGQITKAIATITADNLGQGTKATKAAGDHCRAYGPQYDAGHIIAKVLGGRGGKSGREACASTTALVPRIVSQIPASDMAFPGGSSPLELWGN